MTSLQDILEWPPPPGMFFESMPATLVEKRKARIQASLEKRTLRVANLRLPGGPHPGHAPRRLPGPPPSTTFFASLRGFRANLLDAVGRANPPPTGRGAGARRGNPPMERGMEGVRPGEGCRPCRWRGRGQREGRWDPGEPAAGAAGAKEGAVLPERGGGVGGGAGGRSQEAGSQGGRGRSGGRGRERRLRKPMN